MDSVPLIRGAIRGLQVAAARLEVQLQALLSRDQDYASAGKPVCDYADPAARAELDAWARRSTWPASVCLDYAEPPAKDGRSCPHDRKRR
jgi:hypothetical protein